MKYCTNNGKRVFDTAEEAVEYEKAHSDKTKSEINEYHAIKTMHNNIVTISDTIDSVANDLRSIVGATKGLVSQLAELDNEFEKRFGYSVVVELIEQHEESRHHGKDGNNGGEDDDEESDIEKLVDMVVTVIEKLRDLEDKLEGDGEEDDS